MSLDGLERKADCPDVCKLDRDEREWVHTASKYIDTKHLPMAGKILRQFDDTSTLIGRWVLVAIILGGMALTVLFFGNRFK